MLTILTDRDTLTRQCWHAEDLRSCMHVPAYPHCAYVGTCHLNLYRVQARIRMPLLVWVPYMATRSRSKNPRLTQPHRHRRFEIACPRLG